MSSVLDWGDDTWMEDVDPVMVTSFIRWREGVARTYGILKSELLAARRLALSIDQNAAVGQLEAVAAAGETARCRAVAAYPQISHSAAGEIQYYAWGFVWVRACRALGLTAGPREAEGRQA